MITGGNIFVSGRRGDTASKASANALLLEVNHRAANSLQLIKSLLQIHARHTHSPEVRKELCAAANRVQAVGLVHQRLCRSNETENVDVGAYLHDLIAEIQSSYSDGDAAQFRLQIDHEGPAYLHADVVTKLGIVVTELLTNCMKYAGERPLCLVGMSLANGKLEVSVADNGPGLRRDFDSNLRPGVGMKIVQAQLSSLRGTLVTLPVAVGAHFVITVPIPGA